MLPLPSTHLMEILTYVENLHKMFESRQHISFMMYIYLFNKGWWKVISLFGFALQGGGWEAPKSTRCRGHVWGPAKFYFLQDSAQKELQHFPATHDSAITTTLSFMTFHSNFSLYISFASKFSTNTHQSLLFCLFRLHSTSLYAYCPLI
jgi:hypothetical protein